METRSTVSFESSGLSVSTRETIGDGEVHTEAVCDVWWLGTVHSTSISAAGRSCLPDISGVAQTVGEDRVSTGGAGRLTDPVQTVETRGAASQRHAASEASLVKSQVQSLTSLGPVGHRLAGVGGAAGFGDIVGGILTDIPSIGVTCCCCCCCCIGRAGAGGGRIG